MVDDERWTPGMPVLDRQSVPLQRDVHGRPREYALSSEEIEQQYREKLGRRVDDG